MTYSLLKKNPCCSVAKATLNSSSVRVSLVYWSYKHVLEKKGEEKGARGQTHNPRVTPILIELILGPISVIGGNGQCIPHHILFDIDTKMIAAHMPIRKVCQMPNQIIL